MPKPVLIDRGTLAFSDPKARTPNEVELIARALNRSTLKRQVLTAIRAVLRVIPALRSVRITMNPLIPFGG
jgi:hypothetical protein